MREIGLSRRKVKHNNASRRRIASKDLESVDGPATWLAEADDDPKQSYAVLPHNTLDDCEDSRASVPACQWTASGKDSHLPILAKHVGNHRLDPFVKYPVEMSPRAYELLDTRK